MNSLDWPHMLLVAQEETDRLLRELPRAVRDAIRSVPVVFARVPGPDLIRDGVEPDLMGLFIGSDRNHEAMDPIPSEIILFLENIRDEAGGDPVIYREEVRRTLLHELGHYLGLNEDELWARDLE